MINNSRTLKFEGHKEILRKFYQNNGLENFLKNDIEYLERAFDDIYELWRINFDQIKEVKYLMIAEAPLWGSKKKYIYNPTTNLSQFFYRSDLGDVIREQISSKQEFLKKLNEIGLIVLDISPYPLNPTDTVINYRKTNNHSKGMTKKLYRELVKSTIPGYFENKLELINQKRSKEIKVFFRYKRVKENLEDLITPALIKHKLTQPKNDIRHVSQVGGGIDKTALSKILN